MLPSPSRLETILSPIKVTSKSRPLPSVNRKASLSTGLLMKTRIRSPKRKKASMIRLKW